MSRSRATLRVLMIEDSPDDAKLIVRELERGGYEPEYERVETEEDLRLALDGGERWDLVISDYDMPRLRVFEVLRMIRERWMDVPIVVVSGSVGEEAAVEIVKAGANDYAMKDRLSRLGSVVAREMREAEARRRYRDAETRYRSLVEQIPAITYIQEPIESENPKVVTYMSPQYEAMFGYPPEKETLDEEHWLRTLHPEDRDRVILEEDRTDATGEPFEVEYRVIAGDGRVVWVRDQAVLMRDESGEPLYWQGVQFDITAQKHAEEELRRSDERYRTVFETIDEGFCIIEMIFDDAGVPVDYLFLETNPAFEGMTGLEGAVGRTARELVPGLEEWWFETYGRVALTSEPVSFENRAEAMNRWFEVHASRAGGQGSREVAVLFKDISERRLAEQRIREAREAERSRIATDIHDDTLQSLIYALQEIQILQITAAQEDSPETRTAVLGDVADALRGSVEGLRSAIFELRLEDTLNQSFGASLRAMVELTRRMSRNRFGLSLDVDETFPEDLSPRAGGELIRILKEALNNVRRHSESRSVSVRLWRENGSVFAEVTDDGKGFDANSLDGGVGMSSMRRRAAAIGGELDVRSEPTRGTTVRFEAPADRLLGR